MIGFFNNMNTIMILKIWSELPDMYIMMAFMGRDLAGARATSHDFLSLSVSVSPGVGAFRGVTGGWFLDDGVRWRREVSMVLYRYAVEGILETAHFRRQGG